MKDGLVGGPVPSTVPFSAVFDAAGEKYQVSPILLAAIARQESSYDPNVVSADGGHGLMQLTSSWPPDWEDPASNIEYACSEFIMPAMAYWRAQGFVGDDLVRCVGASYNAGLQGAIEAHTMGDVDLYTTDRYGKRLVQAYHALAG